MKNPHRFPEEASPPVYTRVTSCQGNITAGPSENHIYLFLSHVKQGMHTGPTTCSSPIFPTNELPVDNKQTNKQTVCCCCWSICCCSQCLTAQEAKRVTDYCFHKWASFYFFIIILKRSHLFYCPEPLPPTPADASMPCSSTGNIWLVSLEASGEEKNIWLLQWSSCWGEQGLTELFLGPAGLCQEGFPILCYHCSKPPWHKALVSPGI